MKNYKFPAIMLLVSAAAGLFSACDDDKQLTLNAPVSKPMKEIKFEVSDVLPLAVGMDSTLVYSYGPEDIDDTTVVFTSSDESVATVDQTGKITAISEGDAIIMARSFLGFKVYEAEASVQVHVIPELIKATDIILTNTTPVGEDGAIYVTDELQFAAEILPENHTYSNITWHSSDESIATVDQNGLVKCVGVGKVKIIVLAHDHGTARGEYELDIQAYIPVEGITVAPVSAPICITRGPITLDVTYSPADATLGSVEWTSSDETIATVRREVDRVIVTPVGFGDVMITGKCISNGAEKSVTVRVEPGWYIWDAENQWSDWECTDKNAPDVRGDKFWHVEFPNPTEKTGRNIRIKGLSNNGPFFLFKPKDYPVLAVRIKRPNGGVSKLDDAIAGGQTVKRTKELNPGNGIDLGDGTRLLVYNIGANYTPEVPDINFRIFQFKITDYRGLTAETAFYDIYWIRTFKSEDEAKTFAKDQVARGE